MDNRIAKKRSFCHRVMQKMLQKLIDLLTINWTCHRNAENVGMATKCHGYSGVATSVSHRMLGLLQNAMLATESNVLAME